VVASALGLILMELARNRKVHRAYTVLKSVILIGLGIFIWWLLGYGFAATDLEDFGNAAEFGEEDFAGDKKFAGDDWTEDEIANTDWMFSLIYVMLGLAAMLVAVGPLSERADFHVYMFIGLLGMGFIYPIAMSWSWGGGWLVENDDFDDRTFIDTAGAANVHLLGGTIGLIGCIFLGARAGRFVEKDVSYKNPIDGEVVSVKVN
jgi:Amt family ammonium transporter